MTVLPFVRPSRRRKPSQHDRHQLTPSLPTAERSPRVDPLFRSQAQGQILATLMADPEQEWSRANLHLATYISTATITSELRRAVIAGVVSERKAARGTVLFRANTAHDLFPHLQQVVLTTYPPSTFTCHG